MGSVSVIDSGAAVRTLNILIFGFTLGSIGGSVARGATTFGGVMRLLVRRSATSGVVLLVASCTCSWLHGATTDRR